MLRNITKNTIISPDFELLKHFWNKSKGLIKSPQKTIAFHTRFGIHTFGVEYPIDVIIADKKHRVCVIKENLRPNRVFLWNPKYTLVIELEKGVIKKSETEIGDLLQFNL